MRYIERILSRRTSGVGRMGGGRPLLRRNRFLRERGKGISFLEFDKLATGSKGGFFFFFG